MSAQTGSVIVLLGRAASASPLSPQLVVDAMAADMVVLLERAVDGAVGSSSATGRGARSVRCRSGAGAALEPWLPVLVAIVPGLGSRDASVEDATWPAVKQSRALAAHGRGGLLVLEDLHWADPDTLAIVEHLTDNLRASCWRRDGALRSGEHRGDLARVVAGRRGTCELGRLDGL
jgi:hypothetical protein